TISTQASSTIRCPCAGSRPVVSVSRMICRMAQSFLFISIMLAVRHPGRCGGSTSAHDRLGLCHTLCFRLGQNPAAHPCDKGICNGYHEQGEQGAECKAPY